MDNDKENNIDSNFKHIVAAQPGAHNFKLCFSCGTCTAICPIAEIESSFNPRMIIRKSILGYKNEVLSSPSLWMCIQCYACTAECPQNVGFKNVILALRRLAIEAGYFDEKLPEQILNLDKSVKELRCKLADKLLSSDDYETLIKQINDLISSR